MERAILHCDLNNFYASVETVVSPELRGKAIAICGRTEDRHGIVLAKSEAAKKCGVKTGDVIWQAKGKCPELLVFPPRFSEYIKYSRAVKSIYCRYTDMIEPFGIDECWLDVSGSTRLFGSPETIADDVREAVKKELGLTISVGVSFNKVFAKLGSDMKKPDAVTVIRRENFRDMIWQLPAEDMLWVGRSTSKVLKKYGIITIGDIAKSDPAFLKTTFGKNGVVLWRCANGLENSPVCNMGYRPPVKSVGRGVTCVDDLRDNDEVWRVLLSLSHAVSKHLREDGLLAGGVQIGIKNTALFTSQSQSKLIYPTQNSREIALKAFLLFKQTYKWQTPVRAVTVRAIELLNPDKPQQLSLGFDMTRHEKLERLDKAMLRINEKYGKGTVVEATVLNGTKMPTTVPSADKDISFLP